MFILFPCVLDVAAPNQYLSLTVLSFQNLDTHIWKTCLEGAILTLGLYNMLFELE